MSWMSRNRIVFGVARMSRTMTLSVFEYGADLGNSVMGICLECFGYYLRRDLYVRTELQNALTINGSRGHWYGLAPANSEHTSSPIQPV